MTLVLDAGALISLERGERPVWRRLRTVWSQGETPITHAGVVGQVWRGGARQAQLARALAGIEVRPLDEELGRAAGQLIGRQARTGGRSDVIDAALVLLAETGDQIVTSDPGDLRVLMLAAGRRVELIRP